MMFKQQMRIIRQQKVMIEKRKIQKEKIMKKENI